MSFKLPFNLQKLQDLLPSVDQVKDQLAKVNPGKTVDQWQHTLAAQVQHVQALASAGVKAAPGVDVSELPQDYVRLEQGCDALMALYRDFVLVSHSTFERLSYDYPPGIDSKWDQLKSVLLPQELERLIMGGAAESLFQESAGPDLLAKTLNGHLLQLASTHAQELDELVAPLAKVLRFMAEGEDQVASLRHAMDGKIVSIAKQMADILAHQFIEVSDLRKKVYHARGHFDSVRARLGNGDDAAENPEWIEGEDNLVAAIETACVAMKKVLFPIKGILLVRVFVEAQRDFHQASAEALSDALVNMDAVAVDEEQE